MRFAIIPIILLATPIIEIATFIWVGEHIGILATLALIFATAIAGTILLRIQGFGIFTRMRRTLEEGQVPGREVVHGVMILVAGILLVLPGFVTDTIGILLFIPPVRDLAWSFLRDRVIIIGPGGNERSWRRSQRRETRTIDLDVREYSRSDGKDSPWRRPDRPSD
ncbi:FxsA family protein [Chelativorans sp. Marseille-P2723]|uniref:FxsA family protein n=1 Tax=Chelativorans sp. Marseille-P2723 TaxID=2709133 RepID=UPI0015711E03|nr:FxsA family protein [Chelativorans sp. Marseille-P2723]